MPRTLQYLVLFLVTALVQLLILDNVSISIYLHSMLYLAFVALLPVELASVWVVVTGFAMGVLMDAGSGSAGLNSIAILFSAFVRPLFLRMGVDKDDLREGGGTPGSQLMGGGGFGRYVTLLTLCHCAIYFLLEAATWSHFYLTALRIAISTAVTIALIYLCQLFFRGR